MLKRIEPFLIPLMVFVSFFVGFYFYSEFGHFSNSNDYLFHFYRAQGVCFFPEHYASACENYPGLFHLIAGPFSFSEPVFFFFCCFLVMFVIPVTLLFLKRNKWIVPFYFASSLPFNVLYAGVFPQALIFEFFLLYLLMREHGLASYGFILVALSAFTHQYGFIFMLFVYLIDGILRAKAAFFFPALVLGSVNFAERLPDAFIKFPLILAFLGFKQLIKEKDGFFLSLALLTFAGSFFDARVFLFFEGLLIIPASEIMLGMNQKFKLWMALCLVFYFFFNAFYWLYLGGLDLFLYI